jgi:sugar/nucleoside kinase (ribokinase family)
MRNERSMTPPSEEAHPTRAQFVAVVGTVNHDVIRTADGREFESLGGILYNAIPLAALLEGTEFSCRLYGRLSAEDREEAARLLAGFPAADPRGLIADSSGTNISRLDYRGGPDRIEEVEMRVAPLSWEDLRGVTSARAVLVNMISGRDVELEVLRELRSQTTAPLFLDVQALARAPESPRRPCLVPSWREWAALFDVVRGNETEIPWFAGLPGELRPALQAVLEAGAGEVILTRGKLGSLRGVLRNGQTVVEEIPAYSARATEEPTGCGDTYLAAVCAGRLLGLDPSASCHLGSWAAARVAELTGLASLAALAGLRGRAARALPGLRFRSRTLGR